MSGLKPIIMMVQVGIREPKEVPIYPLSMADQLAMPDKLIAAVCKMSSINYAELAKNTLSSVASNLAPESFPASKEGGKIPDPEEKDMLLVKVVLDLIKENIEYILEKSTDGVTLDNITNEQFIEIVDVVFTINYENTVGKALDLFKRVKKLFQPEQKGTEQGPIPQESTAQ